MCIGAYMVTMRLDKSVFSQRLFSKALCSVGDLFELISVKPPMTELELNVLDHSLLPEWKRQMSNKASEVCRKENLKTEQGIQQQKRYLLKKLQCIHFKDIQATNSEKEI